MYYVLGEDVYIVNGYSKSCIYDLNHAKLYSINSNLAKEVNLLNEGYIKTDTVDLELKAVLDKLMNLGLIILSEEPITRDITSLKETDNRIKFAWVEITSKCNLRCKHCYNESDIKRDDNMSVVDFKKVIDILTNMGVPKIQIIGGEPFFDKKALREMLDYAIGKFEYLEIFTNGTLIFEDEWFDYFKENNIHLALSVYSYNPESHDAVTGVSGSLKKTNETILKLKNKDIPYRICNVLMKDIPLGEKITDLYTLSSEKDIVRMSGRASINLLSDELLRKKLITKSSFSKTVTKTFCKRLISGHNCFRNKIYISANMEVFPCVMERRLSHGNIGTDGILLNDEICFMTKDYVSECSQCEYRYACYDCRPDSFTLDVKEKPWYCTYNPQEGKWEDKDIFIAQLKEKVLV